MGLPSYSELQKMSDAELEKRHDSIAGHVADNIPYYLNEIYRRKQEKHDRIVVRCTIWITAMTFVMMLATIVNLVPIFSTLISKILYK